MTPTRDAAILFRNTMSVTPGHREEFGAAIRDAVSFTEEHGPQLMVEVFFDEERMLAYSFQLYPDSDAIRAHWRMSDPYIRAVMEHCSVERLDVYGDPDQPILDALPQPGGDVVITITPRLAGFTRRSR